MKKRILYNDQYDWEYHVKSMVSPTWFKVNKTISILLNIAVPLILVFVLHMGLINTLLAFIAFDILMVVVEFISIGLYKLKKRASWATKKGQFQKELDKMTPEQAKTLRKDMSAHAKFYDEKIEMIDEKIKSHDMLESILGPKSHEKTISSVKNMIEKMRAYSDDNIPFNECEECIDWIQEKVAKIVEKSDKLMEVVKDNPVAILDVTGTYDIYANEMMRIILKYQDATEEQQDSMKPELSNLLDVFCEKLERHYQRICNTKEFELGVDISYLTKRLKEDEEDKKDET